MLAGFIFLLAPQKLTNKFQFAFARIFSWPLSVGRNISFAARARQLPIDVVSRSDYNKLQSHLANVIEQRDQAYQKIERLSGLRERGVLEGSKIIVADVITTSINGSRNELIINRGEDEGLAEGQFVLGANNIIGTISEVDARTARVRLVTDSSSKIAVKIAELDIGRVMEGDGNNSAKVKMLSIKHKVRAGNNVYALKKPGFLDNPMIIGKVVQCKRDDENPSLWDITVRPACDVESLNDVAVIVMNP
jgi:cell shape-determining protein MreC